MITIDIPKSAYKIHMERRDLAVYRMWRELTERPGAMKMTVDERIMKKFQIHSRATVWQIRKRVERRIEEEGLHV